MISVLDSTKLVVSQSKNVEIDPDAIRTLVAGIGPQNLQSSAISISRKPWTLEDLLQIIFIFNAINFCFWSDPGNKKWTVNIDGEELDGSIALFRCLEAEVAKDHDFLTGQVLANLSTDHLEQILTGNIQIPLFEERLNHLHEIGKILSTQFNDSFINIYKVAKDDALTLTDLLVRNFPCFDDIVKYKGQTIGFYKRAQLNSKMVHDALITHGQSGLNHLDKLTAFADYKVPQILRNLKIIEYSTALAGKVDNYIHLESGSEEEVEIRAATIWAVEQIRQELHPKYNFVTASHVDSLLWNLSQTTAKGDNPYHRALTTAY